GKAAEAVKPLEFAAAKKPDDQDSRYTLARVYQQLGRRADAAREFAEGERLKSEQLQKDRAKTPKPYDMPYFICHMAYEIWHMKYGMLFGRNDQLLSCFDFVRVRERVAVGVENAHVFVGAAVELLADLFERIAGFDGIGSAARCRASARG